MGQYQQTLIIPKPTQRFDSARYSTARKANGRRDVGNRNAGINSILSFFN